MPASESRIPSSSSTMRTLCMVEGRRGRRGFRNHRKFNNKTGAHRVVLLYADRTVMIFYDPANNCQTESGAAFLGGKIWQEEFFFKFPGHAVARVSDGDL